MFSWVSDHSLKYSSIKTITYLANNNCLYTHTHTHTHTHASTHTLSHTLTHTTTPTPIQGITPTSLPWPSQIDISVTELVNCQYSIIILNRTSYMRPHGCSRDAFITWLLTLISAHSLWQQSQHTMTLISAPMTMISAHWYWSQHTHYESV